MPQDACLPTHIFVWVDPALFRNLPRLRLLFLCAPKNDGEIKIESVPKPFELHESHVCSSMRLSYTHESLTKETLAYLPD